MMYQPFDHPVKPPANTMKFYYTYVLRSHVDNQFYIGCTNDLQERFEAHNKGKVPSTEKRRPLELQYYEGCRNLSDARHRERYLKTTHGKRYLGQRLKSYLTGWRS